MTIGERIKQRRLELDLSVEELSKKLGKNRATIYRYENNDIENFSISALSPLANALGVNEAWLMGYDVSMNSKLTPNKAWDIGAKQFEDKINAFYYQLCGLGWTYEWIDDEDMYLLSNGAVSFKITNDQYGNFVDDLKIFCKERLESLYENSKSLLFPNDKTYLQPKAAHDLTDIKVTDEMHKHDEDIMEDEDF